MILRILTAVCVALASAVSIAGDFSQFRGPDGLGVIPNASIPVSWSGETGENVAWSVEVPGSGWSQPVIIGQRVFLTSAIANKDLSPKNFQDGVRTPQSMGMSFLSRAPDVEIEWKVICLSARTGDLLWEVTVDQGKPKYPIHPSNTYATETPVADSNGIYAYFGATGKVAGLSLDGELLWEQDVGSFKTSNNFGTGSSLAILDGKVYVQNLSQGSASITAIDSASGNIDWQRSRDKNETSWSSPIVWKNAKRSELIVSGGQRVDSYDPYSGETLWSVSKVKAATACSVCADGQRIYFGGSDPFSTGPLFAIAAGGKGDLSPKRTNGEFNHLDWMVKRAAPGMASPVSNGSLVFVVDKNILRCYDAATGKRHYQERVPKLTMVNASPLIVGDRLLLVDENGNAALVRLAETFEVVGSGTIPDTFWSTPAVDSQSLYLRGLKHLYCVRSASIN